MEYNDEMAILTNNGSDFDGHYNIEIGKRTTRTSSRPKIYDTDTDNDFDPDYDN